jgi:hypothetical protein
MIRVDAAVKRTAGKAGRMPAGHIADARMLVPAAAVDTAEKVNRHRRAEAKDRSDGPAAADYTAVSVANRHTPVVSITHNANLAAHQAALVQGMVGPVKGTAGRTQDMIACAEVVAERMSMGMGMVDGDVDLVNKQAVVASRSRRPGVLCARMLREEPADDDSKEPAADSTGSTVPAAGSAMLAADNTALAAYDTIQAADSTVPLGAGGNVGRVQRRVNPAAVARHGQGGRGLSARL